MDLSIAQITVKVGYGTVQVVARIFRQETGMSPSHYRRFLNSKGVV